MTVTFDVLGEPRGKGRPRFSRSGPYVRTYTPAETAAYENLIRLAYQQAHGPLFDKSKPLSLHLWIYMKIPESASKTRKLQMIRGEIRPTKKPDIDNVLKAVLDGLNTVAYHDDVQIVQICAQKFFSDRPKLTIVLTDEEGEDA